MSDEINSRVEGLLKDALDENETSIVPRSRIETILKNIINDEEIEVVPKSRVENLLLDLKDKIANGSGPLSGVEPSEIGFIIDSMASGGYIYSIKLYGTGYTLPAYGFKNSNSYGVVFKYLSKIDCLDGTSINSIRSQCFSNIYSLKKVRLLLSGVGELSNAFMSCSNLSEVVLLVPNTIDSSQFSVDVNLFASDSSLSDIYVSWSEGDVPGAPWGAVNATIHYDTPLTKQLSEDE